MQTLHTKLLFDRKDHELLKMVREVLNREASRKSFKDLLNPYLNPHGIKEMATSQAFRIAYAMTNLLHSLEIGKATDRLSALRSLHDEVMNITHSFLRRNTARVLLQIMKELVRVQGDPERQLELAHDFRMAVSGRPRFIRSELQRYHLLEMPEAWNQIAFDDHVHDANTKGRKTPTHLIMDAWIKGIRRLTVIYYNFVPPEAADELMKAGEIMGITIRIGVSLGAHYRSRSVRFIWVPRGFCDARDFLSFLAERSVRGFMEEGRLVSEYRRRYVLKVLEAFNQTHRPTINDAFRISLPPLESADFLAFVGSGQASLLHLAEFIHTLLQPLFEARVTDLRGRYPQAGPEEKKSIETLGETMQGLDSEAIVEQYLKPAQNPTLPDPDLATEEKDFPGLMRLSPRELLQRLDQLHNGYRICLNLSDLRVEDVLDMLYDCRGMITHLEIFNLKDHVAGKASHYGEISELQRAINEGNVIMLKRLIRGIRQRLEPSTDPDREERIAKLTDVLCNIPALQSHYRAVPLGSYIGSDSTGRSRHLYGMGLVIRETLSRRTQKALHRVLEPALFILPVRMTVFMRTTVIPRPLSGPWSRLIHRWGERLPGLKNIGAERRREWEIQDNATRMESPGNIIPLGGFHEEINPALRLTGKAARTGPDASWRTLNSGLKNLFKVLIGFIPAFLTFALSKDWWLLAYGGAFIWFGITGLRHILQSVLGGGGVRRSPLLRWNDLVGWERLADSLLFTGFSVPLLDYLVKTLLLDRGLGINAATAPVLLYSVMALTNGLYLSSHNAFRGFPRGVIYANFFRSVLSIPIAIVFNAVIGGILYEAGAKAIDATLQKWAAVISKAASDCVAGVIEGLADRYENIRVRTLDYAAKLDQLFNAYAKLELLYPEKDLLTLLKQPKQLIETLGTESQELERILIINALDLLYFWMYQPRARSVLKNRIAAMSDEERRIFFGSQGILQREKEISQLFLDGIIGRNFSRGLAFYLDRYAGYLEELRQMVFEELKTPEAAEASFPEENLCGEPQDLK